MVKKTSKQQSTAKTDIETLTAERDLAESKIVECSQELEYAKQMLASIVCEPITTSNKQYHSAAMAAWRASIEAYEASVKAYLCDHDSCVAQIDSIQNGMH